MNCDKFADMLDNYACLSDEELRELEAHSEECESCASELDFMRSILATAKELPPIEPPSDFLDSLNSRLDAELAKENPVQRFMRRSRPYVSKYGAIAACVALVAVVGTNAGVLITRMNNNGNGVISEQKTAFDPAETGERATSAPIAESAAATALPQAEANGALGNVPNTAVPAPTLPTTAPGIAASTKAPVSTAPSAGSTSAAAPAAAKAPAAQSRTTPVSQTPSQAASQPSVRETNTQQEAAPAPAAESVPQAEPAAQQETAAPPAAAAVTPPAAAVEQPQYEIAQNNINSANEYASVAEYGITEEDYEAGIDAELSDYTLANLGTEQASTYASLSSTVSVKAKDADRVRELVDVFVNGVYGNYYMITSQDMDGLLGQFDREGIWYDANITESGDRISFRLVIMQID